MKKLALTILFSALISSLIMAQDSTAKVSNDDPSLHFGLKLTPTWNWFSVDRDGYDSDGAFIGYTYGLMMDFRLAKNYFFATGLEISQKGGKLKSEFLGIGYDPFGIPTNISGSLTQRLQYVDIPVALKLKTNEIGHMQYYGHFGLLMGFMIKANQDIEYESNTYGFENKNKRNNQSDFGFFNLGLNVGLGAEYNIAGNTDITVGIGYQNGFVDIWADDNAKITNNQITLNFGVFF